MKPKQQIDPNAAGDEVKRLLAEDGTANVAIKDLRSAKAARKEALKSALTIVWEALGNNQTVNGYSTREEWAKNFAGCSRRHCEHIVYGRKPSDANKRSHTVTLKDGGTIKIGGKLFRIESAPTEDSIQRTKMGNYRVSMLIEPIEKEKPTPKKKELRYSTKVPSGDFITMPAKPHKTHKMSADGRRTWCGKRLGDTLAADAKMSDAPTCRNCQTGEQRHLVSIENMKKQAERMGYVYDEKTKTSYPKVTPKTHVLSGVDTIFFDADSTACGIEATKVNIVSTDPTCRNCRIASRVGGRVKQTTATNEAVLKEFKAAKKRLNKAIREFKPLSDERVAANENDMEPSIEWLRDGKVVRSLSGEEFEAEYERLEKEFNEAHAAFTPIAEKAKALGLLEAKPEITLVVKENCPTEEEVL